MPLDHDVMQNIQQIFYSEIYAHVRILAAKPLYNLINKLCNLF